MMGRMKPETRFRVKYRNARVWVAGRKLGMCMACGEKGRTEMHHWHYAYTTDEVRKDPQLANHHTIELCFKCHRTANMIKNLADDEPRTKKVSFALRYLFIAIEKEKLGIV